MRTGQWALRTTASATLPSRRCLRPRRPWVPMTMRSAEVASAMRATMSQGAPTSKRAVRTRRDGGCKAARLSNSVWARRRGRECGHEAGGATQRTVIGVGTGDRDAAPRVPETRPLKSEVPLLGPSSSAASSQSPTQEKSYRAALCHDHAADPGSIDASQATMLRRAEHDVEPTRRCRDLRPATDQAPITTRMRRRPKEPTVSP